MAWDAAGLVIGTIGCLSVFKRAWVLSFHGLRRYKQQ